MILTYAGLLSSSRKTCQTPFFLWADSRTLRTLWHGWDDLHIVNGLLVKGLHGVNGPLSEYVFVIPEPLLPSVLQGIHSSPFSGHLGITRTLYRACKRFCWPKMSSPVTDCVRSGSNGAANKLWVHSNTDPLQSVDINEPFAFGQWITWVLCPRPLGVMSICWSLWTISPNGVRSFPPRTKKPPPLLTYG